MSAPTSPRLTMRNRQPMSSGRVAVRLFTAVLGLFNPLVLLVHVFVIVGTRTVFRFAQVGRTLLLIGLLAIVVCIVLGQHTAYVSPWIELVQYVRAQHFDTYVSVAEVPRIAAAFIAQHWLGWLIIQLPFSLALGATTSGAYLTWRDYYTDTWRSNEKAALTPASARAINKAKLRQTRAIERAHPVQNVGELNVPLGIDSFSAKDVNIPVGALRTHALVCGPTGVGKTQTLMRLIHSFTLHPQAADLRVPLVVIDMKADPDLAHYLEATAQATHRRFMKVTTKAGTYNPLAGLDPDEIADSIYETVYANDPTLNVHYATLSRRLLQTAAFVLDDLVRNRAHKVGTYTTWQRSLADLTDLLSIQQLRLIQTDLSPAPAARLHAYLQDLDTTENLSDVGDVRDRLAVIMHTTAGNVLNADGFTLEHEIKNGSIILFSLDAAGTPETARTIGTLAIQDLTAAFGRLQLQGWGKQNICPVILDEFSALATQKVADLYARARSAGGSIILATQDIDADLSAVSPEFAATVRTNANVWIVLRQTRADVAEALAKDIGSRTTWKETLQITDDFDLLGGLHSASGVGSLREVEEFIIHPSQFKNLPQGGAYLIIKIPTGTLNHANAETQIHRLHVNAPTPLETKEATANAATSVTTHEPWPHEPNYPTS